jgi:hypothetical protein
MHELAAKIFHEPHVLGNFLGYEKLTEIHGDWIKKMWGSHQDVRLMAHRGSYKTTALSVVGPIWYHLFKPEDRILLTRKTYTNACDTLNEIVGHYRGPKIKELYRKVRGIPDFKLKGDRRGQIVLPTKTRPSKEGSLNCAGIDTKVTGMHFERQHNDDTTTVKDKVSEAARAATRLYHEEQENLRNPGGTIGNVGTMWHKQDANHIEIDGKWIERPGILKFPIGTIAIPGFTPEYIAKLKQQLSAAMYACNYELIIIAGKDRIFPDQKEAPWPEQFEWVVAWLDPAYKGTHHTALAMIGYWQERYHARGWVWRRDATEMGEEIAALMDQYKAGTLYVESNADKGWAAKEIRKHWPSVVDRAEKENKHIKILSYAKMHFLDLLFAPDTQPDFMAQVLDYIEGEEPDDAPDALASLIREIGMGEGGLENRYD